MGGRFLKGMAYAVLVTVVLVTSCQASLAMQVQLAAGPSL